MAEKNVVKIMRVPRKWQMPFDLEGKVVMITGASSGLGLEFCLDLVKAGCQIIAAARRTDRLKTLCDEINATYGGRAVAIELDVTAEGQTIDAVVQKAWDAFGHIDALINNAGVRGTIKSSLDITEDEWNSTLRTNLTGSWLVSKSVCTRMREAKIAGSVINISSISGLNRGQFTGAAAYVASKAALDQLTKVMALEMSTYKIRVNSIAPGIFRSKITEQLMDKDWLENWIRRAVPLKTLGTTDPALTSLLQYLIHESSEYITGNIFIVDAGITIPGIPLFSSL
uniref:3-oxoacyl-[acyl-carrier-protein] reductase n=2 Tax=Opuntia streptacantha TaxID=393608 RepID=A0A7C8YL36_OPUST